MRLSLAIMMLTAVSAYLVRDAGAQTPINASALGPIRITIISGPTSQTGNRVEVVRRANRSPRDIVVVAANATAEDVAAALQLISGLRLQYGDSLTTDLRASPQSFRPGADWAGSPYQKWIRAQLVRLKTARERRVSEYGTVRLVAITLPAPRGRFIAPPDSGATFR